MPALSNRYVIALGSVVILMVVALSLWKRALEPPLDERLIRADNELGFKLFGQLANSQKNGNVVISPVSAALSLQMTYHGARRSTREAMAKALCLNGMSCDEINHANARLLNYAQHLGSARLDIANSLWAMKDARLQRQFMETNKREYQAEVTTLDLHDPSAVWSINSWVKRKTGGRTDEVVRSLDPLVVLLLINVTYFKGEWTHKFDKSLTDELPFHLASGRQKMVPMMYQKGTFLCSEGDWPPMIRLPYGDGKISMYILLTADVNGSPDLEAWDRRITKMKESEEVEVYIPRFRIRYSANLMNSLTEMGMGIAFDPIRADLSGIHPRPAWIGLVQHDVMIEVDEGGTEAAAVTDTQIYAGGRLFMANRPFFFVIQDDRTGLILFIGWVADPTQGSNPST